MMGDEREVSLDELIGEMMRLVRSAPIACLIYVAIVFASGVLPDILAPEQPAWFFAGSVVSLAAGYVAVRLILQSGELVRDGSNGIGSYIVLSILITLASGLGLLLLILPGLYLLLRWMPAYGVFLSEDIGIVESLGRSWDLTSGRVTPLAIVMLMLLALLGLAMAIYLLPELAGGMPQWPSLVVGNLLIALYNGGLTITGLAAYGVLREQHHDLDAVFA